jgi:hypothetical protein
MFIVIRPNSGVDPVKELGLALHGLTWVNPKKFKKYIFEVLIFHMEKLRNNPYEYRLYIL